MLQKVDQSAEIGRGVSRILLVAKNKHSPATIGLIQMAQLLRSAICHTDSLGGMKTLANPEAAG